jgi:sterol desaturase/sphingolipid hydroxylase (fatty acid hydroxylase superfamily)
LQTLATAQQIYANQLHQNSVIMWMVVAITLSGVILAGIQLWATYRLAQAGKGTIADGGEVMIEQNRLVVRSSVVGVVILALSFAFFAVYVLFVYRITDMPGIQTVAPRPTAGAEVIAQ